MVVVTPRHPARIVCVVEGDVHHSDDGHSASHLRDSGCKLAFNRSSNPAHVDIAARFPISVIIADEPFGVGVNVDFQPRHAFVASASVSILSAGVIVVRIPKSKPPSFVIGLKQAPRRIGC